MKSQLPKTSKGFTLVELLVVISILAILGTIGITILSNTQKTARDAKRKGDIEAMSKAMEANYVQGTGYPTTISATWFADGVTPSNPGPGGAAYITNTPTTAAYVFCATLESSTGNSTTTNNVTGGSTGNYYCVKNAQ